MRVADIDPSPTTGSQGIKVALSYNRLTPGINIYLFCYFAALNVVKKVVFNIKAIFSSCSRVLPGRFSDCPNLPNPFVPKLAQ